MWLTQSLIGDWHRCQYRWHLVHRQNIRERFEPGYFGQGAIIHGGLEHAVLHCPDAVKGEGAGVAWIVEHAGEWTDEAVAIFRRAFATLEPQRWETVVLNGTPLIEAGFALPIEGVPHIDGVRGTADWVCRELDTGDVWLLDWKTRASLKPLGYDRLQLQAPLYQLFLHRYGVTTAGSITFQIRRRAPETPKLTKGGKVSRAKIVTDWGTFRAAVEANGQDPAEYADVKAKLGPFDRIDRYLRTEDELDAAWHTVMTAAHDISATIERGAAPSRLLNPYLGCSGCSHRTYCEADMAGADLAYLLATKYTDDVQEREYPTLELPEC